MPRVYPEPPLLSELRFGSFWIFVSRSRVELAARSRRLGRVELKQDLYLPEVQCPASEYLARRVREVGSRELLEFMASDLLFVPVPKSTPHLEGSLWAGERIATALSLRGFGTGVARCIRRIHPVRSAHRSAGDRPEPREHYDSMEALRPEGIFPPAGFLLVDDIVTQGATMIAAATRLREAFPEAEIRGFAAMRTISEEDWDGDTLIDPVIGSIKCGRWATRSP